MITRTLGVISVLLLLGACSALVDSYALSDGSSHDGNISLVNGRIEIGTDCRVDGQVNNVNGRIQVGRDTQVLGVRNVNGRIDLANEVEVDGDVSTVNGRVELGESVRVSGDVESVNGRISAAQGAIIGGTVSSVNGSVELHATRAGGLLTSNSHVRLEAGTVIEGELRVRKRRGLNINSGSSPKIIIGRDARIQGPLTFEREVELYVHESAAVGEISGAEAIRYTGDNP